MKGVNTLPTYEDHGYRYYYDPYIKSWTIYTIDQEGFQRSDADYYSNKDQLKKAYPELKFKRVVED